MKNFDEEFDGIEGSFSTSPRERIYATREPLRWSSLTLYAYEYPEFASEFQGYDIIGFDNPTTGIRLYSPESGKGGWNRGRHEFTPSPEFIAMITKKFS